MNTTYSAYQYEMAYPPGIERHWWTLARNTLIAGILREEAASGSLMEVGCGKGVVVKSLSESGFDISGVELAEVEPLDGAQHLVQTATDACELSQERRAQITGLLLLDVLEHLPEPGQFLKKLEQSFPNLSFVVITVPTCQELWSNYDSFAGHFRRYTLESIAALASEADWTVGSSAYFFRLSYLPMRLLTLFGKDRNLKIEPPGKWTYLLHRLVAFACQVEQKILPGKVRGSSAYAVLYPGQKVS